MKKIIVEHFSSLDNYGTGMMGLVTVNELARRLGAENVGFYCDFEDDEVLAEVKSELSEEPGGGLNIYRYTSPDRYTAGVESIAKRRLLRLWHLLFSVEGRDSDMLITLGGDDLSEYYGKYGAGMAIFKKWKASFVTEVVLLGQTIGPFGAWPNRFAARYFLPRMKVYSRDRKNQEYLKKEFGLTSHPTADLAFLDLPLQKNDNIVSQTMNKWRLAPSQYITIVISAGQTGGKYYCRSRTTYLKRHKELIETLCGDDRLNRKKVILLAHTFGRHGEEASYIEELKGMLGDGFGDRIVYITEKILPTRARIILGNGMFTVTGRMHAAVSTFQNGKPAVCLSYSTKFGGVIGENLGRADMVIEANGDALWESGKIVQDIRSKIDLIFDNYDGLAAEIKTKVGEQKRLVSRTFDKLADMLSK